MSDIKIDDETYELVYVYDTMCGWCHVAKPRVLEVLTLARQKWQIPSTFVHRRLFTGNHVLSVTPAFIKEVRRVGWEVGPQLTGQRFGDDLVQLIQRPEFQYSSHLSSLACAAAEIQDPASYIEFSSALQAAFFEVGIDVTNVNATLAVAARCGYEAERFQSTLTNPATLRRALETASRGEALQREVHSSGVPTLLLVSKTKSMKLDPYDINRVVESIERAINGHL